VLCLYGDWLQIVDGLSNHVDNVIVILEGVHGPDCVVCGVEALKDAIIVNCNWVGNGEHDWEFCKVIQEEPWCCQDAKCFGSCGVGILMGERV